MHISIYPKQLVKPFCHRKEKYEHSNYSLYISICVCVTINLAKYVLQLTVNMILIVDKDSLY